MKLLIGSVLVYVAFLVAMILFATQKESFDYEPCQVKAEILEVFDDGSSLVRIFPEAGGCESTANRTLKFTHNGKENYAPFILMKSEEEHWIIQIKLPKVLSVKSNVIKGYLYQKKPSNERIYKKILSLNE